MTTIVKKMSVLIVLASGMLSAFGCQNVQKEGVQLAEARWARARASVMLQLADQQYKSGQLDKALVTVGQVANLDPSLPGLHILRGQVLAEKGQGQQAIGAFETAIAMDPNNPQPHYFCGVQYEKWGQFDKALAHYQAAADLAPNTVSYPVAVAETLGHLNRTTDALAMIDQLLTTPQGAQSVALRVTAGELCQAQGSQGDYERAAKYFRDAARLATDDTAILRSLALALHRAGRHEEARGYLEQLANQRTAAPNRLGDVRSPGVGVPQMTSTADPSNDPAQGGPAALGGQAAQGVAETAEVLNALGDCYLHLNMPEQARDRFLELTRLLPNRVDGWDGLAKAALYQRQWDQAIAAADKVLALTPNAAGVPNRLPAGSPSPRPSPQGEGESRLGTSGNAPGAYLIRGYALLQQGRAAEAVWVFQQAHRLTPKDVMVLCLLADGYRKAGDSKSARESLVRAVQIAPDDPLANRMMNELAQAEFGPAKDTKPLTPPTVTAGVRVPED